MNSNPGQSYIYTYACHEDERELCALELRTLLAAAPQARHVESLAAVDPSRSPFIRERITVTLEAASLEELAAKAETLALDGATFKLSCVDVDTAQTYEDKRAAERYVGQHIHGRAEMRRPDRVFGIARAGGRWILGDCLKSEAIWLAHNAKPRQYSTALSTRVARAAANIAVPRPAGIRAVDPCCGIGTVLIEALSMGIDMVGYDINPLAVRGARENLNHFGMPNVVRICDINELEGDYDALILDLPYNLCSVLTEDEQLQMLKSASSLAERVVLLTTESIDTGIVRAGLEIRERCEIRKGHFVRYLLVCKRPRPRTS